MFRLVMKCGMVLCLWMVAVSAFAQEKAGRDYLRSGNRLYRDSMYTEAEVDYRKAIEADGRMPQAYFNLGNTEKAFEMLDKYLDYVASDQDAWNGAFQLMMVHSEDTPEFKDGVIRIYEKLVQWNEENMGFIQLTPTATALVEAILSEQSQTS